MKPRHKRIALIAGGLAALGFAAALVLNAFQSNLVFFFSPSQVVAKEAPLDKTFRICGMVEDGSLKRLPDGSSVEFKVTATAHASPVTYTGILADRSKRGKGLVAQGPLGPAGMSRAPEVPAKPDENHRPPDAA